MPFAQSGIRAILCLSLTLAQSAQFAFAAPETLKVGGTGAALGTMRLLGEAFERNNPRWHVEVLPYIGSTGAIKGVATGAISLGLSGRPAKEDEQAFKISLTRYALTPLVLATHPGVSVTGVKRHQLAELYSGQQTKWDDGKPVRLILRPSKETDNDALRAMSPDVASALDAALARKGIRTSATDQEAADAIEQTPGALGTTTLALAVSEKRKLKILALDGVMPTVKTMTDGSYPYHKPLYLVTPQAPSEGVKAFVDFVRSPRGRTILSENGQMPVAN